MSSTPHDGLFKAVFSHPEHARGALHAVVPTAMAEALDWSTLALQPGSFVDPLLIERHTDLLFTTAWRGGAEALVYLLFEHQSTSDPQMAFRLLRYMVRIWDHWLKDHEHAKVLPAIVPIVLCHGDASWSAARTFDALLDVPEAVRPALTEHLVRFSYVLLDLSEVPDDELRGRAMTAWARLAVFCLKHARPGADFVEILRPWAGVMLELLDARDGFEAFTLVMRYILNVNSDAEHQQELRTFVERELGPKAKEALMTAGEQLIQQGIQQGERGMLLRLLRKRFGAQVTVDTERRVATAAPEQIGLWAERVLSAATLAELLAD